MKKYLKVYEDYHSLTNYLGVAMLYLKDNFLLEDKLEPEHIKARILGHWGTVPGINLVYGGLNILAKEKRQKILLVNGPGHGAPAIIANQFVEGTLSKYYSKYSYNLKGLSNVVKDFSWPKGLPSHTYPGLPGTIHEGGELGYALGVSYGASFDYKNLLVACIIGDGEFETSSTMGAWQSNKFINPREDGTVLPIVHVNGYKISGPTVISSMSDWDIKNYFRGLGYLPLIVDQRKSSNIYSDFLETLDYAYKRIKNIKSTWNPNKKSHAVYPVIILKTKKGWGAPAECEGVRIEDHYNSHGVPLAKPAKNEKQREALENWLKKYDVKRLLDDEGKPNEVVRSLIPGREYIIGDNEYAIGHGRGKVKKLKLPNMNKHKINVVSRGGLQNQNTFELGEYLSDLMKNNASANNFRLFSPDETESNQLHGMYTATTRRYTWKDYSKDESFHITPKGRIMEVLNENLLHTWYEGYVKTGRHGLMISYESFFGIIASQIDQYIKYVRRAKKFNFREPLNSMNYLSSSVSWRQDHNGYSHQNPSLISTLLSKHSDFVSVYLPADVNTLLATFEDCGVRKDAVNLIIAGKRELPQWLKLNEAREHVAKGISIWGWVSSNDPDVVLASAGDYQTQETLAACYILKDMIPEIKLRYVNVNELTVLGLGDEKDPVDTESEYRMYFTKDKHVVFNFHGYPEVIKQLVFGTPLSHRITVLGYIEEGSTTTPFDMQVQNKCSRYHVCIRAVKEAAKWNKVVEEKSDVLIKHFKGLLSKHEKYIVENGDDIPEVKNFNFKDYTSLGRG